MSYLVKQISLILNFKIVCANKYPLRIDTGKKCKHVTTTRGPFHNKYCVDTDYYLNKKTYLVYTRILQANNIDLSV